MRAPRLFVDLPLISGQTLTLPAQASQHLVQVLRLRSGDPLVVFNGDGRDFSASLVNPSRSASLIELKTAGEPEPPPPLAVHLAIGVSKGERMDIALQKSVELGVTCITPLFARRSVVRLSGERAEKRMTHWRGVIRSACEQSGRRRLPTLTAPTELESWLRLAHAAPTLLDPRSSDSICDLKAPEGEITLLVGPEGGFDEAERALALNSGFRGVRLGPRILRTETAPLAAIAAVQALWGDFRS